MNKLIKRIKPWVMMGLMIVPIVGVISTLHEYFDPGNALTVYEKTHSVSCSGEILRSRTERLYLCFGSGLPTVLALNITFPLKFRSNDLFHVLVLGFLYGGGLGAWAYFVAGRLRTK